MVVPRAQVERAQRLAHAEAGVSSRLRDLALVLDWALNSTRVVALRRSEARELERLAAGDPTSPSWRRILAAPRRDARAA